MDKEPEKTVVSVTGGFLKLSCGPCTVNQHNRCLLSVGIGKKCHCNTQNHQIDYS